MAILYWLNSSSEPVERLVVYKSWKMEVSEVRPGQDYTMDNADVASVAFAGWRLAGFKGFVGSPTKLPKGYEGMFLATDHISESEELLSKLEKLPTPME